MALAFDAASGIGTANDTSVTLAHTTTGTNRYLVVFVSSDSDNVTGVTYNSVAMTQAAKKTSTATARMLYCYVLHNPASGANNIVASASGTSDFRITGASYTGAQQTTPVDASATDEQTSVADDNDVLSITTVADNCWLIATHEGNLANPNSLINATARNGTGFADTQIVDSNAAKTPPGAFTIGWHYAAADTHPMVGISIAPFVVNSAFLTFMGPQPQQ